MQSKNIILKYMTVSTTGMSHIAIQKKLDGTSVTWMELVTTEQDSSIRAQGSV